ncbi:MAG: translation initiation factor IF-1 [Bacteroidota bacterium]
MTKQPVLEKEGTVTAVLRDMRYWVVLNNGFKVLAYSAGKLRKRFVKIVVGDRVKLEISPDEISRGRIVYRYRN